MNSQNNPLLQPVQLGELKLKNRIVLSPLTRCRAGNERIPNDMMAEYYRQRASAGLLITEATSITPTAVGYPATPGIWSEAQIAGWRKITEAVHQEGGLILLQLWHVGRLSDPIYLNGQPPVAPSAVAAHGHVSLLRPKQPYCTPRALATDEVESIVQDYQQAAKNAQAAGFDGVEVHGANGYLLEQFLHTTSNLRKDKYGGSIENRARMMLEVVDAVTAVWSPGLVGIHLSPRLDMFEHSDEKAEEIFTYLADQLGRRNLAFIFTREHANEEQLSIKIKNTFNGPLIANESLTPETARRQVEDGKADAVAFGKYFISNPDLVERIKLGAELAPWKSENFYSEGPEGYTDYPTLKG